MYPLGKQFVFNNEKSKSDSKSIIKGHNYRISVISDRIVRLEYSPSNNFNDRPTELVRKRNIGFPSFSVQQDENILQMTSKYFTLSYVKGQPFLGTKVDPMKNLKITLNSKEPDRRKDWYYTHPEARNLGGNIAAVDFNVTATVNRGIYSLDGFSSIDDSLSKITGLSSIYNSSNLFNFLNSKIKSIFEIIFFPIFIFFNFSKLFDKFGIDTIKFFLRLISSKFLLFINSKNDVN